MAYSTQRATSDGTLDYLALSIAFLDRTDIQVFFDDLPTIPGTDWNWDGSNNAITFPAPLANGVEVLIARSTELAEVLNVFSVISGGGGSAKFTNTSMDENFKQLLLIAQEAKEGSSLSDVFQNLDMHGFKITNIGDGDVGTSGDIPNMGQIFTISGMAGTSATNAATSASQALSYRNTARTAATNAASDANAQIAPNVNAAVSAKNAAVIAQGLAEAAAGTAASDASAAANALIAPQTALATTAKNNAVIAQGLAEDARDLALSYRNSAGTYKNTAGGSATTATTQAGTATTQANLAKDWASKASGTVASGLYSARYYATQASSSASAASGSASAAAGSAGDALTAASDAYTFGVGQTVSASYYTDQALFNTASLTAGMYGAAGTIVGGSGGDGGAFTMVGRNDTKQFGWAGTNEIYHRGTDTPSATTWSDWRKLYDEGNIVGTVSQSGGTPTGAVVERGSNANGEYTRWADGTQICYVSRDGAMAIDTPYGSLYQGIWVWSFPKAFIAPPAVPTPGIRWGSAANWCGLGSTPSTTSVNLRALDITSRATDDIWVCATAIGRWY